MDETQLSSMPMPTESTGSQQPTAWMISTTSANPTLPLIVPSVVGEQQQRQQHAPTPTSDRAPLSLYERVRHFLYVNFLVNKVSFVLSILAYLAQLLLFVALNLYLFSNVDYLYEFTCVRLPLSLLPPTATATAATMPLRLVQNGSSNISQLPQFNTSKLASATPISMSTQSKFTSSIKQSYLTLQIISLFVFFICFILAGLIRLQFKYHRLALNLYDFDLESGRRRRNGPCVMTAATSAASNTSAVDRDGADSLASTTTGSHFSSSMSKRLTTLLKRILHRLLTKIASILLYVTMGYHFCQNCFIESGRTTSYTIFMHVFIAVAVVLRTVICVLEKRNGMNKLEEVKKLQRKQTIAEENLYGWGRMKQRMVDEIELAPAPPPRGIRPSNGARKRYEPQNYYSYYYTYLIKYNQSAINQLKQHQQNQTQFRVFHLNDVSLLVGFTFALFHLFAPGKAVQHVFVFAPILCTLVLLRLKSVLNGMFSLALMFTILFYISSFNSEATGFKFSIYQPLNLSSILEKTFLDDNCGGNHSMILEFQTATNTLEVNFYGLNLLTLASFLVTLYLESALGIYYCTLTSLERWNLSFLSGLHHIWRHIIIWSSLVIYLTFAIVCGVTLLLNTLNTWRVFVAFPIYLFLALFWCAFQLLNTINLLHLLNKIGDCLLMLNESNSVANSLAGGENLSNHSRKSKSNRHSTLSQQSQSNQNLSSGSVSVAASKSTRCSLRKLLSTFLNYHKLNMNEETGVHSRPAFNVPIHRILNYKGVRHLGSISYRISLYCMALTLLHSPFAFISHTHSHPITLDLYAITVALSLIYLSLLYQFPATQTGSCVAYVCVAPPLAFNIYQTHTMSSNKSGGASTTMMSSSTGNSSKTGTTTTSSKSSRTASSMGTNAHGGTGTYMPFNYQQALQHRCAYLLQRMQAFLQFHLIDNFGCDLAPPSGFRKSKFDQ